MAVVRNRPGQRLTKRFNGIMHTAIQKDGRIVYKVWPKKRGKTKAGPAATMRATFGWAAKRSVYAVNEDKIFAEMVSKGTMYYPRDILISAMYGTLIRIRTKDGRELVSERKLNSNAQLILDQITKLPGSLLVRGGDEWVGLAPGLSGQVLQAFGPGFIPQWVAGSGGGGGNAPNFTLPPEFDPFFASGSIFGGNTFLAIPLFNVEPATLTGLNYWAKGFAGGQQVAGAIYHDNGGTITGGALLSQSALHAPVANALGILPFTGPVALAAQTLYWLGFWVKGTGNANMALTAVARRAVALSASGAALPTTAGTTTANAATTNMPIWAY